MIKQDYHFSYKWPHQYIDGFEECEFTNLICYLIKITVIHLEGYKLLYNLLQYATESMDPSFPD